MSESNPPSGFKKRLLQKASSKLDRKLSPLNPAALNRDGFLDDGGSETGSFTSTQSLTSSQTQLMTSSLSAGAIGTGSTVLFY